MLLYICDIIIVLFIIIITYNVIYNWYTICTLVNINYYTHYIIIIIIITIILIGEYESTRTGSLVEYILHNTHTHRCSDQWSVGTVLSVSVTDKCTLSSRSIKTSVEWGITLYGAYVCLCTYTWYIYMQLLFCGVRNYGLFTY